MNRRTFLKAAAGAFCLPAARASAQSPNIVLIYADDLGYGDLGCYGSSISTPNLDRMAAEGVRFTDFYSGNPVCSPSRAALMTGRYPARTGVYDVLFPSQPGLPDSETTIAQVLKKRDYRTICIGKWHLGDLPAYLPTRRGFDEYFGIPYSNDMNPRPLMYNEDVVEPEATLETLTARYTQCAVDFIDRSKDAPFFLYMPHTSPHIPLAASPRFHGHSPLGLYGDVIEELDWSVGQVLEAVRRNNLEENTLVLFSSDNGPWYNGSPGRLRGRKGTTWEGGMRVPCIARCPGRIPQGLTSRGVGSAMDLLPTIAGLCGAPLPENRLDGIDIWPLLSGEREQLDREALLYFDSYYLQCARLGAWKLHVSRQNSPPYVPAPSEGRMNLPLIPGELYNLEKDPDESYDQAEEHPEVVEEIRQRIERLLLDLPEDVRQTYANTQAKAG
jgi:arylsulfatase